MRTTQIIASYREEKLAPGAVVSLVKCIAMITGHHDNMKIKNGKWKEFNKHAILIADGFYLTDKKHGTWREYYDATGTIMIEETYKHGIQHGPYTAFYPNGQVCSKGQFFNGSREGFFKIYDEQGNNIRNLFFLNNLEIESSTELIHVSEETGQKRTWI